MGAFTSAVGGQVQPGHGAALPCWVCLEPLQKLKVKWAAAASLLADRWHGDVGVPVLPGGPRAAGARWLLGWWKIAELVRSQGEHSALLLHQSVNSCWPGPAALALAVEPGCW